MLSKLFLKIKIEAKFHLIQRFGLIRNSDKTVIPKYQIIDYLPTSPVIIDCGAHTGSDSIELAKLLPDSTIYAFEPVPDLYIKLRANVSRYKNISCHNLALGDNDGFTELYVSSGGSDASSSLLMPTLHLENHPGTHFKEKIIVRTLKLDSWAEFNQIGRVDFLWLDMQGYESFMLRASEHILLTVKVIYTEVSLVESYLGAPLYTDLRNFLESKGFQVVIEALPSESDMGNVLFVRK